jgi:signal transduction histidine kinase/ActR/RegA family two-component response regulator
MRIKDEILETKGEVENSISNNPKMKLHLITLSFYGLLETKYREDYFISSLKLFRISFISGLLFFAAFAVLDFKVLPEVARQLSFIRFLFVYPFILAVIILSYTKGFKKYWQLAASATSIVAGIAIILMILISPEIEKYNYYTGIILILMFCHMLIKIRFIYASIAGWTIVICYILSTLFYPEIDRNIFHVNIFFLISANIIGMFGSYSLEYYTRRDFYYRHLLKEESKKVELVNIELENRVREKTKELQRDISSRKQTEIALLVAKEKAEESEKLKSAFLANMSHEIRTPMNGILGFSNLLNNPDLTGEKHDKYIEIIQKSSLRMLDTINDLIKISKIEVGLIELTMIKVNINLITSEVYSFFKPVAEEKGLKLIFTSKFPDEIALIKTDKEKLRSIITNLIKNAIKFTIKGEIEFGFNLCELDGNSEIEFFIKDTGIGISKDSQKIVFNRFVQDDSGHNRAFEGSGLGLSITKSYVELLGGKIWVESEVGKGTMFRFTIPYFKIEKEKEPSQSDQAIKNSAIKWLKNKTLLIAEDEDTSSMYLGIILGKKCGEILYAENGNKVVEMVKKNPQTSVILMDIRMPEKNGYQATREIRKFNKDVIIIAQTAYAMKSDQSKALEAGCDEHITKPINETTLMLCIGMILKNKTMVP